MLVRLKEFLAALTLTERLVLGFLVTSFFVGLDFGFPLTVTTNDEMYFVGGVFRALAEHSIFPQGLDVPYGTLNYLLSYILISISLVGITVLFGFNLGGLESWVFDHYYLFYLAPRLISVLSLIVILAIFYYLAQVKIKSVAVRLTITILLFSNLLVTTIFHTGKVWPLTTALLVVSFFCLYRVLMGERHFAVWSIIFACLALTNFPLAGVGLVVLPVLFFYYRRAGWPIKELIWSIIAGVVLLILVFTFNYEGIYAQVFSIINDYTLSPTAMENNASIPESLVMFLVKTVLLFGPLLVALMVTAGKIVDRKLFWLSLFYLIVYLAAISVTARWAYELGSYFRYLLPVSFWLTFILLSFNLNNLSFWRRFALGLSAGVTLIYFVFAIYYLLTPATLNLVRTWTIDNLNHPGVVIINDTGPVYEPPLNQKTAVALIDYSCGSRCRLFRTGELVSSFEPLVIDSRVTEKLPNHFNEVYRVSNKELFHQEWELVYSITNPLYRGQVQTIDSFGDYFNWQFFKLNNWGDNFYIYRQK